MTLEPTSSAADQELVEVSVGELPIILTAPHGGTAAVPGVAPRAEGARIRDFGTRELALAVAARLTSRLGKSPNVVVAHFHRRYIDGNRPPHEAFTDPAARRHYEAYHGAIRRTVDSIRCRWPQGGILIDLHGQSGDPATIYRGTQNGQTMRQSLDRVGWAALEGPASIMDRLRFFGYAVYPSASGAGGLPESLRFNGGYTVQTYGSHRSDGIDALQIEIGAIYRHKATIDHLAADLAEAVATYYAVFLEPPCAEDHLPATH